MKRIISALLCVALVFSFAVPCFAASQKIIISGYEYTYAGVFALGENTAKLKENENNYYLFTPDKDGLYGFLNGKNITYTSVIEKLPGDNEYTLKPCFNLDDGYVVRLKENEQCAVIAETFGETEINVGINIVYLGEIESISLTDNQTPVLGYNISNSCAGDNYIELNGTVMFTCSDKKYTSEYFKTATTFTLGENTAVIDCCGTSISLDLYVRSIDDFIEAVTAPEDYKAQGFITYDDTYHGSFPEYINIKYKNGKSEKVDLDNYQIGTMNIPELGEANVWLYFDNGQLISSIANKEYSLGIKAKNANKLVNTLYLGYRIGSLLSSPLLLQYYILTENNIISALKACFADELNFILGEIETYKNADNNKLLLPD